MNEPPIEDYKKLYALTGQLILLFASAEVYLSGCLRFNLSHKIDPAHESPEVHGFTGAVFGSIRFKAAVDIIKRVVEEERVLRPAQTAALQKVFEHFGHIASLRDKLAHQYTTPHPDIGGSWLISDSYSTRRPHSQKAWQITNEGIRDAALDLDLGRGWLGSHVQSAAMFSHVPDEPPTWRYKPSSLKLLPSGTGHALLARTRPPSPSQA